MIKKSKIIFSLIFLSFISTACIEQLFSPQATYDARKITIQSLSLFNQRISLASKKIAWKGDWIFRRDRLDAIDQTLRGVKPDVLIFQEIMEKKNSPYDTDQNILAAGSLLGYSWQTVNIREFNDSHELESMGLVTGLPVYKDPFESSRKKMWKLGKDNYLSVFIAKTEGHEIAFFNLKLSHVFADQEIWYSYIKDRIQEYMSEHSICPKRLVLAGIFGGSPSQKDYINLLQSLQLEDSSLGFCELENPCYTETPENPLFLAANGDTPPRRDVRILIHRSALIYSSNRNFNDLKENHTFFSGSSKQIHSSPVEHFGWLTSVRFARCNDSSLF